MSAATPNPRTTIHVVGSIIIDRVSRVRTLPRAGETVAALSTSTYAGGKGANQAAAAAKCGARVRMLGRTGSDGAFIRAALREAGVGVRDVATDDPCSGAASVMVAEGGENAIVIAPESNMRLTVADIERFLAKSRQGEIVLFQNECACLHEGIAAAAARGLRVWLNAAPADTRLGALRFEKLAGLVVNETEAAALPGARAPARALEALARRMPGGTVIVTLGAQGAIAAVGSARYAHRGFVVDAVDTVGCGDAFVGAFLAGIASGLDIVRALARGNAAGALAAMRAGAMPSLPEADEVAVAEVLPEGTRLKPRTGGDGGVPIRCEACDYALSGSVLGDKCPECGRVITTAVFGGRWSSATPRRRFFIAAWALAASAAMLAVAVPFHLFALSALPALLRGVPVICIIGSLVLTPAALYSLARNAASPSQRNVLRYIALSRFAVPLALLGSTWLGLQPPVRSAYVESIAFAWMAACDGAFAWMLGDFVRKTAVPGVPDPRRWGLVGLAAMTVAMWLLDDSRGSGAIGKLSMLLLALVWLSAEFVRIARCARALERA